MASIEDKSSVSRRQWLGTAASASLGSTLLGVSARAQTSSVAEDSAIGARTYNVRDFGAKGDGQTLSTIAFQAAVDACNRDMGGTVLVPAGVFLIGTVELKSNVRLHLASGCVLRGSADGKQYHAIDAVPLTGDATLNDGNVALIFAVGAENVTIDGNGTIDGLGDQFRSPARGVPPPSGRGSADRPYHLLFHRCKNLTIRDITLKAGAFHSIRVIQSQLLKFEGLHIHNRVNRNNDGFHFVSCEYVHISNCDVVCQDDACALFGSCKFVTVTNCSFTTRWSVFRFGGGIAENIVVSNCLIYQTFGCPIKMRCGPGSRFENMSFSNLIMNRVTGPFSISVGSGKEEADSRPPGLVRNIQFSNIEATVVVPIPLADVPFESRYNPGEIKSCIGFNNVGGVLESISLDNVRVSFPGGGTPEEASVRDVPLVIGEYYAAGVLPAYALYARSVRALELHNVRFSVRDAEARPAIVLDHVEDATLEGMTATATDAESLVRLVACKDILISSPRALSSGKTFLEVEGDASENIKVQGGDISRRARTAVLRDGASKASVTIHD